MILHYIISNYISLHSIINQSISRYTKNLLCIIHIPFAVRSILTLTLTLTLYQLCFTPPPSSQCNPHWKVSSVQDATECIRYLRTNNFAVDVLLVDMHLGEAMTGSGKNCLALLIPNPIIIYRYILYILFSGYPALTPHHTNSSYPTFSTQTSLVNCAPPMA